MKKPSAAAVIVAVIFSILLFPMILAGGIGSGTVFSVVSVFQPDREEDIYQSFVDNGGIDWVYDQLLLGMEEGMGEEAAEMGLTAEEFFPKAQVETIVYDVYHAIMKGAEYQLDLSYQKDLMRTRLMEYFNENIEDELRAEYGEEYDLLSDDKKAEVIAEAEKVYAEEIETLIEDEFGVLETELSANINSIYDMEELQELKELEAETGFSLTDRTELCYYLNLGGYMVLGITAFLIVLLLLCHLFRPSGFITAGVFALIDGGLMTAMAKVLPGILNSFISNEMIAGELAAEEIPSFAMTMVADIIGWCMTGFEKVGKIGLMTAVVLILVGILLLVMKKNKADAEQASAMEMQ